MSKTRQTSPTKDEEVVAELPMQAIESMPAVHSHGTSLSASDPADFSAAALARNDTFTCAKRSYFGGDTIVVRIVSNPLAA